jgi:hypothetical protein
MLLCLLQSGAVCSKVFRKVRKVELVSNAKRITLTMGKRTWTAYEPQVGQTIRRLQSRSGVFMRDCVKAMKECCLTIL